MVEGYQLEANIEFDDFFNTNNNSNNNFKT
jgi:hypothetical protein